MRIRARALFLSVTLASVGTSACSRSNPTGLAERVQPPSERALTGPELLKLYDPAVLVAAKSLHDLPKAVQDLLGVDKHDYGIADVGEKCEPSDVIRISEPTRCYLLGGMSPQSALVAYKVGGYEGQSVIAVGYVHTKLKWIEVKGWKIGFPNDLKGLLEMTSLPPDDGPPPPLNSCFRQINGRCSY
jgi:hypothetical protein